LTDAEKPARRPNASRLPGQDEAEIVQGDAATSEHVIAGEVIQRQSLVSYRSAPYPTPGDLRQYEEIHPGFTDRILSLTERESEHRIQEERLQNRATIDLAKRGQKYGLIVVVAFIAAATAAILTGHSVEGLVALAGGTVTIVSAFGAHNLFGRREKRAKQPDADELPEAETQEPEQGD
jgi:uncharacterized membrane protein